MSHYEKLAVVIIRAIGCCVTVYALIAIPHTFLNWLLFNDTSFWFYFEAAIAYVVIGIVLFAVSKPLAALIARRL